MREGGAEGGKERSESAHASASCEKNQNPCVMCMFCNFERGEGEGEGEGEGGREGQREIVSV